MEVLAEANEPDVLNAFDIYCKNENLQAFFQAVDRVGEKKIAPLCWRYHTVS